MTALEPKPKSLRRYGWTMTDWQYQLDVQGGVCALCDKLPPSRKLVIDHVHVKGWKRMPPEKRRRYVRALVCNFCNRNVLRAFMTLDRAHRLVDYFQIYGHVRAS